MTDPEMTVDERITLGTDAHAAAPDEDPLDHLGEVIPDPWADDAQADWGTIDLGEVTG